MRHWSFNAVRNTRCISRGSHWYCNFELITEQQFFHVDHNYGSLDIKTEFLARLVKVKDILYHKSKKRLLISEFRVKFDDHKLLSLITPDFSYMCSQCQVLGHHRGANRL